MKTVTVAEFQDMNDDDEPQPSMLGALADQMARRNNPADPFDGMSIDVDPADAFGLVQANVTAWLEERGIWATPIEVRHKVDQIMQAAQEARPGPVSATYTVNPDGTVGDYVIGAAERELPGMPGHPEAPAADPVTPSMLWDPAVWGKVVNPDFKATTLWEIPQNREFTNGQLKRAIDLDDMVDVLVRTVRPLTTLSPLVIGWYWKLKGGRSRGKPVLSRVAVADKTLAYERQYDVIVHLSADHLRKMKASALFVERLVFDALARIDPAGPRVAPDDEWSRLAGRWRYGWLGPDERLYATLVAQIDSGHQDDTTVDLDAPAAVTEDPVQNVIDALHGSLTAREDGTIVDGAGVVVHTPEAPLDCSVCGAPLEMTGLTPDEIATMRANPAVVLCEDCGEDGIQDDEAGDDA